MDRLRLSARTYGAFLGKGPGPECSHRPRPSSRAARFGRRAAFLILASVAVSHTQSAGAESEKAATASTPPEASRWRAALEALADNEIQSWTDDPPIVAVLEANLKRGPLSEKRIAELETLWRQEFHRPERPLQNSVTATPAAEYLSKLKEKSDGLFTEIFLLDSQGLTVTATQADASFSRAGEEFWKQTAERRTLMPYVSAPHFNDDTGLFQAFVAATIMRGENIAGVVVAGVDTERFDGRF